VKRVVWIIAGLLMGTLPVLAFRPPEDPSARPPHLPEYLALQTRKVPGAVVTSGFDDWRNPSKYRAKAGLHLGYDVAMPAGSPAVAGWRGRVTRILQWHGPEYGVTVLSPNGYEATYGHLRPRVSVGDSVTAGDTVGTVVHDHVDIKVRGPDGVHYDFGKPPGRRSLVLTRAELLRRWLRTRCSVDLTEEEAERVIAAERKAREALARHPRARAWMERAEWRRRQAQMEEIADLLRRARRRLESVSGHR